ncbi:Serine/threonine-protein kinase AtPK2/AtPK19 [Hibiscus syriacus]|uniref:non-specific serine/threonine protein kinase n=1 Tax=Hibiscus syriacus TaxID=106335 RepID=A0A6A3BYQ2_HIBSY|nr:Serine/threonine-protein kinase AtPK2/AtPK19 [Hibiscus syriacus]
MGDGGIIYGCDIINGCGGCCEGPADAAEDEPEAPALRPRVGGRWYSALYPRGAKSPWDWDVDGRVFRGIARPLHRAIPHVSDNQEETNNEVEELSGADDNDMSLKDVKGDHMKVSSIGIEDFEVRRKEKIMEKNHAEYMKAERDILTKVDHPFIVQLGYSFQTKYRLYLILDFINGGHLFFHLHRHGLFREDQARIYAAEIVSAVSHLHANGIMHRDLKPENILLDADGHIILTDFGLAKQFDENTRSNSLCGTVEYMAPEIITGKDHDKAADWWSVSVLIFEMLTGKPPFTGGNREKIQQKIVKERMKLPKFLSSEAHSLLKGLLHKDPSKRLGSGPTGSEEIKRCKWLKTINWKKLEAREIQPGFRPEITGKHCIANFDDRWTNMPLTFSAASSPKTNKTPS